MDYAQHIFTGLTAMGLVPNVGNISTTTTPNASDVTAMAPFPTDITGLIRLVFTFSALRDWLKLILLGGLFETVRRLFSHVYGKVQESFWMNAYFEEDDPSYEWMMVWLAKQPNWAKARDVEISTESYGNSSTALLVDGKEGVDGDDSQSTIYKSSKKLTYYPSLSKTYSLWYKRRWVQITRTQQQTGWYGHKERTLHISILTRSQTLLIDLLKEARKDYMSAQEHKMCVYVSDINNNWKHVACRARRSLSSVVLDQGIKSLLLEDARDFLSSKSWYTERGIPFRRGYLLYGAPGSGKTSLIHCLAGELCLDVYVISLSRTGLDDSGLDALVNDLPERCIALMEDIDAAFVGGINRENADNKSSSSSPPSPSSPPTGNGAPAAPPPNSRLSLSGLLNALDGISAQEGRILFATTNHYNSLDPALCRPGRMDIHVEFKLASKWMGRELFRRFYVPVDVPGDEDPKEQEEAEEEELISEEAIKIDDKASDSGYSSTSEKLKEPSPPSEESSSTSPTPSAASVDFIGKPNPTSSRSKSPSSTQLTLNEISKLALQFARSLPEREISMAALQGYLMQYKTRPREAVKDITAWIEAERERKRVKEGKEKEKAEKEKKEKEEKEKKEKEEKEAKEKKEKEEKEKDSNNKDNKKCTCQS